MKHRRINMDFNDSTEINISPMIDMVFILLIFFIVTTVFIDEHGLDVDVPQPANITKFDNEIMQITVTDSSQVMYEGRNIGLQGIRSIVRQIMHKEKIPLLIGVESRSTAGLLVKVMDEAKLAGVESISINHASSK